jgi:hypothetical protein
MNVQFFLDAYAALVPPSLAVKVPTSTPSESSVGGQA